MERAFGVEVYNEYGAAELDIIAMEDLNHHFILNNETLLIELLDDLNKPVGIGESGRVVVTSLYNKAMPFIRYDIGDMAILGEPTETHHTLKSVEGRRNDSIQLPSGKISPGLTIYYVVKLLFEEKPNIKEFVVHQIKLDTFEFHYTSEKLLSDKEKTLISKGFDIYLESGLKLMFKRVDKIERTLSGKMKTFVSHLN
jgi:phenylacetate-CoA ligase